ncbi:MAG: UbiA family prenyltransferase [Bacteroidia bacterium]|nr:UbiA family prenyltransferase [Bacteroidia bacterium]MDW8088152.1 UbiA family prenyltransferase [Bacteroidia bacterium]
MAFAQSWCTPGARSVSALGRRWGWIPALIRLSRPLNLGLILSTSLSALLLTTRAQPDLSIPWLSWVLMISSSLLIAVGGYWLNDLYDQPIDRLNRPQRAFWVALVGQRILLSATLFVWALGLLLSGFLPWTIFGLHGGAVALLVWYARWGKKTGLLGNAAIALLTGLVPWEVLLLLRTTSYAADWMIPLAISFNFVREIVKDAEDLAGDRLYGVASLAARLTPATFSRLLVVLWLALMALCVAPAFLHALIWHSLPWGYLFAVALGTVLPLSLGFLRWSAYGFLSGALKVGMGGGLLALWFL